MGPASFGNVVRSLKQVYSGCHKTTGFVVDLPYYMTRLEIKVKYECNRRPAATEGSQRQRRLDPSKAVRYRSAQ
jgi:hypothetical protein